MLAQTGDAGLAAEAVGLTANGAYQLRRNPAGKDFKRAWYEAIALYRRRNTIAPGRAPPPPTAGPPPQPPADEANDDADRQYLCDSILEKYLMKLVAEREARLDGRIVEADFYVRQLSWLEVALDLGGLGGKVVAMLKGLKRGERHAGEIVATPMSLLLDSLRREFWAQAGDPERPPPPGLGAHPGDNASSGAPLECQGGITGAERAAQERQQALQAEAQLLWEEKARADAAAWRERLGLPTLAEGYEAEGRR